MKENEKPTAYLVRRGWVHKPTGHAWQWQKPPAPGLFTYRDAVTTQEGLDKAHKTKD